MTGALTEGRCARLELAPPPWRFPKYATVSATKRRLFTKNWGGRIWPPRWSRECIESKKVRMWKSLQIAAYNMQNNEKIPKLNKKFKSVNIWPLVWTKKLSKMGKISDLANFRQFFNQNSGQMFSVTSVTSPISGFIPSVIDQIN